MNPAFFNIPVATFTVALRTPSMWERNSCSSQQDLFHEREEMPIHYFPDYRRRPLERFAIDP
jgi:hypothetical protein